MSDLLHQAFATRPPSTLPAYRSKTLTAWLALVFGAAGVHRWYLHGPRDIWAWLFLLPSLAGLAGVLRMRQISMDDPWGWLLVPLLGLSVSAAMLCAIVYALTPDEKWDARYNPGHTPLATGWGAVMAAIFGLLFGGTVFMSTITFAGQMFFEWERAQAEAAAAGVKTKSD
jgi:TM2 domain